MPIKRTEEPRCAIEYVISKMYSSGELFQRIGVKGMHFAGVEWWFQDVSDGEQPKTFHTDCDLQTEVDRDGVLTRKRRNPSIGSVLYLSREGGATVAFGQRRNISISSAALCPRLPHELVVVHPRQNRLFMFDGDLFHAVMHPQHPANMRGQRVCLRTAVWSLLTLSIYLLVYHTINVNFIAYCDRQQHYRTCTLAAGNITHELVGGYAV